MKNRFAKANQGAEMKKEATVFELLKKRNIFHVPSIKMVI